MNKLTLLLGCVIVKMQQCRCGGGFTPKAAKTGYFTGKTGYFPFP